MNFKVFKVDEVWSLSPIQLYDIAFQKEIEDNVKKGLIDIKVMPVGAKYSVEQQGLWHKLVGLYYKSGLHSSPDYDALRTTLKYRYGVVKEYVYILEDGSIRVKKSFDEPPYGVHERMPVLKSTAEYRKDEYSWLIDGTVAEMKQSGIMQTNRFSEEFTHILEMIGDV